MSKRRFFIADVFAEKPLAGNQVAVFVGSNDLDTETMQSLAREMNYSETTFVEKHPRNGAYATRIFTPDRELPFAGHPTLGTAAVVRALAATGKKAPREIELDLEVGRVPVTFEGKGAETLGWLHPKPPKLGPTYAPEPAARLLKLSADDIDPRFPVQVVDVGIAFLLVPLRSLEALRNARFDVDAWQDRARLGDDATGVYLFAPESYEEGHDMAARMFFESIGPREDPATGSASACVAAYIAAHRYFGDRVGEIRVEQGYEVARPSLVHLRMGPGDGDVAVGGRVQLIARGRLL